MKKCYLLSTISFAVLISFHLRSQEVAEDEFKPYGDPILTVFTNFHLGLSEADNKAGFEIRRAYLGYEYFFTPNWEMAVKLDIGSPNDASAFTLNRRFAYVKNAYVRYNFNKLMTQFGIVDVYQFKVQERYWAHRYIWESFLDEYNFGPSADLGWNISYGFNDFISADLGIYNGEGYSKIQNDNAFKFGLGVSVFPLKGLIVRMYADAIEKGVYQTSLAGFVGYRIDKKFIGGVEYNYQYNYDYRDGEDRYGYSVYGSYYFARKWQVFARYDQVFSNILAGADTPWDLEEDGSAVIGGVEFSPIKQIKIALNYQDWVPYAKNLDNLSYIYLNFEYKL